MSSVQIAVSSSAASACGAVFADPNRGSCPLPPSNAGPAPARCVFHAGLETGTDLDPVTRPGAPRRCIALLDFSPGDPLTIQVPMGTPEQRRALVRALLLEGDAFPGADAFVAAAAAAATDRLERPLANVAFTETSTGAVVLRAVLPISTGAKLVVDRRTIRTPVKARDASEASSEDRVADGQVVFDRPPDDEDDV